MNSKKNLNAIRRYSNTTSYNNVVTNPIKTGVNCNAFKLFTNNLQYYKTKVQHKHFDKCSMPYDITMDNIGNAYLKFSDIHDVVLSDVEIKTNTKVVLMALDVMSERAIKLTCQTVRDFILKEIPNFYFNGIDLPLIIREYKKQHDIKHRTDRECLVFRPKKPAISKGARKLGVVVGR